MMKVVRTDPWVCAQAAVASESAQQRQMLRQCQWFWAVSGAVQQLKQLKRNLVLAVVQARASSLGEAGDVFGQRLRRLRRVQVADALDEAAVVVVGGGCRCCCYCDHHWGGCCCCCERGEGSAGVEVVGACGWLLVGVLTQTLRLQSHSERWHVCE